MLGSGGVAIGLPFLEYFGGTASAAPGDGPKRLLVFYNSQGTILDEWRPSGTGANFELSTILQPLSQLNPATGEPFQNDIVVCSGLDNEVTQLNYVSSGHFSASRALLTCQPLTVNLNEDGSLIPEAERPFNEEYTFHAAGPSIEQVIAQRMAAPTAFSSADFLIGTRQEANYNQAFYAGADDPIQGQERPSDAFDRLFGEFDVEQPTALQRIRSARGSVLDAVGDSFSSLNGRLGGEDRQRLEAHAEKIRTLENRISGGDPLAACVPPESVDPAGFDPANDAFDHIIAPQMIDLAVMALACDLTRVSTIQFARWSGTTFPWLGVDIPGPFAGWHGMVHDGAQTASRPHMITAYRWYTEMFTYLLDAMASVPEGDGTMLDNSLVLWVNEFGDGSSHQTADLPIVMAGGLGGCVQTGQHLQFEQRTMNDLCTTVLQLFGYQDECFGYDTVINGRPTCTGPLPGIIA